MNLSRILDVASSSTRDNGARHEFVSEMSNVNRAMGFSGVPSQIDCERKKNDAAFYGNFIEHPATVVRHGKFAVDGGRKRRASAAL